MFDEEEFGKKPAQKKDLEPFSLDELDDYVEQLKEEITRTQEEKKRKKAHMASASSVFK